MLPVAPARFYNPSSFVKASYLWLSVLLLAGHSNAVQAEVVVSPLQLKADRAAVCSVFLSQFQQRYVAEPELWSDNQLQANFAGETTLPPNQAMPLLQFQGAMTSSAWQWLTWQPLPSINQQFGWDGVASSVVASTVTQDQRWQGRLLLSINNQQYELFYLPDGVALPTASNATDLLNQLKPYQLESQPNAVANLFVYGDAIYQLVKPWGVQQVWPSSQPVCELALAEVPVLPTVLAWRETLRQSFVGAVADSLAIEQANAQLNDWLARPWLLPKLANNCQAGNAQCISRSLQRDWLQFYASQDAWSAREAGTIRELQQLAALQLKEYFQQRFKATGTDAAALSEQLLAAYFAALTADLTIPAPVEHLRYHAELPSYPLDLWPGLTADKQQELLQQKNGFGKTALMLAAHFNDYDSAKHLLAAGASLLAKTVANDTFALQASQRDALSYAAENAHPAVISLLFSAGANAAIRDSQNQPLTSYLGRNPSLQWRQLSDKSVVDVMMQGRVPKPGADCPTARQKMPLLMCTSQGLRIYADELQIRLKKLSTQSFASLLTQDHMRWQKQLANQCQQSQAIEFAACVKSQYRVRIRMLDKLLQNVDAQR